MTGTIDYEAFLSSIPESPAMVAACAAWEAKPMVEYRSLSGAEFQRTVGDDPDRWADAAMAAAEDLGYVVDRDWLRSLLADAMEAARKGSIREVIEGDST